MKINLLAAGLFAAALVMPVGVYAQQSQPPAARSYDRGTPSQAKIQHRWMRRFGNLNLSNDQQQRVQSIINQYSQAHPQGSPRDPGANRDLRHQLMGVLSPDQQNQYREQMRARRAQMQQRRAQMQQNPDAQGYQQGAPDQRYQQGPPNQGPPQDQGPPPYQGAPQDQGPPPYQGGPQDQGPPPYQGAPPNQGPPQGQGPPPGF
jgi:Spy/CpxP family protein refolding chaperone